MSACGPNCSTPDWSPGFAGAARVAALERLFSFIPYMPKAVGEFDTDQEVQLLLQGKCTAVPEYTGTTPAVDAPSASKVVGKIDFAATPSQTTHGPAIGTFICGIAAGAPNTHGGLRLLRWVRGA